MNSYNRVAELENILLQYYKKVHFTACWQRGECGFEPIPGWYINLPNGNIEFVEHPNDDLSTEEFEAKIVFQML